MQELRGSDLVGDDSGTDDLHDLPIPELIGIGEWDGRRPVILVAEADCIDIIAANYPRAHVMALPQECDFLLSEDSWGWFLRLLGADVSLWPINSIQRPFFEALVGAAWDGGVRTLRWAERASDDFSRYSALRVIWKDRVTPKCGHPPQ